MSERSPYEYGVLLPHFGSESTRERIVEAAVALEGYGFDAVWVRDHVVYHPHAHEDQDPTFIDPFVALSAVAAVTKNIKLATGSLIPHRHPIHAALLVSSLDMIAGPGRVLVGLGLGTSEPEFQAVGMGEWDRRAVLEEQVRIARALWAGEPLTFDGQFYRFANVRIRPVPGGVPVWYCGTSEASVRRAVEYCDGWIPGAMPQNAYRVRMERLRKLADKAGRALPRTGVIPWVSPAPTVEEATRKVDVPEMLRAFTARGYVPDGKPAFESLRDLGGGVMAGPADVIVEETRKYQDAGAQHLVYDLRLRFADWEYCVDYLGARVLPKLRKEDARAG